MVPGEYILKDKEIELNSGRESISLEVKNTSNRPVQIGSHFHFFEVNKALVFDRKKAFGKKLDIASGAAVRFESGEEKRVSLVFFGGKRLVYGLNGLVNGSTLTDKKLSEAVLKAQKENFKEV
ncbi:MAG: urease subunit beta [Candidatus Omnitrophica bacterium]|nr:urease subunit beta [Candidatus Omnitrophota bacterium]